MTLDSELIVRRVDLLRHSDPRCRIFGSDNHQYRFRPKATSDDVRAFEEILQIQLPSDYRTFVTEVGNGGAGPYYGILGLDQLREIATSRDTLARPFPYDQPSLGRDDILDQLQTADDDEYEQLLTRYWAETERDGLISICEYGCDLRFILVVNGPERGNVWFDQVADLAGFCPVTINPQAPPKSWSSWCITENLEPTTDRVTFSDWYLCWLDWAARIVDVA